MHNAPRSSRIAIIGELNVDLLAIGLTTPPTLGREILAADFQLTLGSASAIFACGIAKLGHEVTFISQIGEDDFGKYCLAALQAAGIPIEHVIKNPATKTGVTISLSTRDDRALVTYLGAIAELEYKRVPLSRLQGHRHLHMTSYFLQRKLQPDFPKIFSEAKRLGLTTSFDPNSDPDQEWRDDVRRVFDKTDVLFVNESEAQQLTKQSDTSEALKTLAQLVACVVIKQGARGAIGYKDGKIAAASPFTVEAIDTTGAGDSFAAGFIHGVLEGKELRECLIMANACGALSTLRAGGTAGQPDRTMLNSFLKIN
jgi:sugar/nucleoside kinase (ribokinase family)